LLYHAEDVGLARFNLHTIGHPNFFEDDTMQGDDIFIGATQPIFDISLFHFESGWDDLTEEVIFTPVNSFRIEDELLLDDGIHITGYISMGTLPWNGIMFYDAQGEQYFFAINHDNSDSPHWFMLRDITEQVRFGWGDATYENHRIAFR